MYLNGLRAKDFRWQPRPGLTCRPADAHLSCGFAHRAGDEGGPFRLGDVKRQCFRDILPRHASGDAAGGCRRPRDGVERGKCLAFPMCWGFFVDFAFRPKLRWARGCSLVIEGSARASAESFVHERFTVLRSGAESGTAVRLSASVCGSRPSGTRKHSSMSD